MAQVTKAQLVARIAELEAALAQEQALRKYDNTQSDTLITALKAQLADAETMLKARCAQLTDTEIKLRQQIRARNRAQPQVPAQASPDVQTGSFRVLNAKAKALIAQGKRVLIRGNQLMVLP